MDRLYLLAGDLELHLLAGVDSPLPDQPVTGHYYKDLPLGVMPMLALGNAGLADIDRDLAAVSGVQQLRERASRSLTNQIIIYIFSSR